MTGHRFCRDLCLERGEPLEGTGDAPERALLLAWPRGKWRTPSWESVGMSPALAAAINEVVYKNRHIALVDRVGDSESLPQLMAQPEGMVADFTTEDELIAAIHDYAEGRVFPGRRDARTVIVCCTDSRRDACCARYGFSTYKALDAIADKSRFHIVQATHIGGCRFAASLIVMPQRQRYGRMTAGQAPAFLECLARGEVFLPAYKGRTDQPEALQVAELAAQRWAEDHKENKRNVRILDTAIPADTIDGMALDLKADVGMTRLDIRLRAKSFMVQGNCETVAENGGEVMLRWCLDGIKRTSDAKSAV